MTLDEFIDIHKDATPLQKLNLLVDTADIYAFDRVMAYGSNVNGSIRDAEYYGKEVDHMDQRMHWLYEELKVALKEAV